MVDIPATPLEKFLCLRMQYIELGKEFKENDIRRAINAWWKAAGGSDSLLLPIVEHPEHIPESPERARAVRMDDREAKAEMDRLREEATKLLEKEKQDKQMLELMQKRIEELEKKLAEAGGEKSEPVTVAKASVVKSERPDLTWTKAQLVAEAQKRGLPVKADIMSKSEVLQLIIEDMEAQEVLT